MAKRGRKPALDRPIKWRISIPFSIASRVDLLLSDPTTGTASIGARSELLSRMLRQWLEAQGVPLDK